jgi:hypothetical protein
MRKPHILAAAVAAVALGAGVAAAVVSAAPDRSTGGRAAAEYLSGIVRATAANRYGETWASLDPAQQHILPRDVYVRCERQSPIPGRLESLRVLAVRPAALHVPAHGHVDGWAVRMRVVIGASGFPDVVVVHTFHAIRTSGAWHWYLPAERLGLYDAGCGQPSLPKA